MDVSDETQRIMKRKNNREAFEIPIAIIQGSNSRGAIGILIYLRKDDQNDKTELMK